MAIIAWEDLLLPLTIFQMLVKLYDSALYVLLFPVRFLVKLIRLLAVLTLFSVPILFYIYVQQMLFEVTEIYEGLTLHRFRQDLVWPMIKRTILFVCLYAVVALPVSKVVKLNRKDEFEPERMKEGSELLAAKVPAFQAGIYGLVGNKWVRSGQAFVANCYLITANHVVQGYTKLRLVTQAGIHEFTADAFETVEGDVAMALIGGDVLSLLGLKPAVLVDSEPTERSGLFCAVTGFDHSSLGLLKPNPSFGFLTYGGSTVGGFSGAPYCSGNRVYGMHLGGCNENIGYSSAYLNMLIRSVGEDTEDFVVEQASRAGKYTYQRSPYNPDEFRVKVGHKYYLVDNEGLGRLMQGTATGQYRDAELQYEPENETPQQVAPSDTTPSVLTNNPVKPNKREAKTLISVEERDSFLEERPAPATAVPGPSSKPVVVPKPRKLARSAITSLNPQQGLAGHKQTRAQRDEVLQGISKFSRKLKLAAPLLIPKVSNKSLKALNSESLSMQLTSLREELDKSLSTIGSLLDSIISTQPPQQV